MNVYNLNYNFWKLIALIKHNIHNLIQLKSENQHFQANYASLKISKLKIALVKFCMLFLLWASVACMLFLLWAFVIIGLKLFLLLHVPNFIINQNQLVFFLLLIPDISFCYCQTYPRSLDSLKFIFNTWPWKVIFFRKVLDNFNEVA